MEKRDPRNSAPLAPRAACNRPQGEAYALANPGQIEGERGAVSGVRSPDPIVERALQAVLDRAKVLSVDFEGKRLWVKPKRSAYEIHVGKAKLGVLTQEQLIACEVDHLFELHRSVLFDVVAPRPEGMKWPEWSGSLRGIQWALGLLMNAAVDEIRLAERNGKKDKAPESLAYQTISCEEEQDKLRAVAAKQYARSKSEMWRLRSEFTISGATMSCASQRLLVQYKRWRDNEIGYPSWSGPNGAIYVRADSFHLEEGVYTDDEGAERPTFVCRFKVSAGRGEDKTHECAVRPNGDSARTIVRRIAKGEYEHGDATLLWNERKKRWQFQLSYTMPRQEAKAQGAGTLAVRRSVQDMLFVMNNEGDTFGDCKGMGLKILDLRRQFNRRKSEIKSTLNLQGKGARGHGKKRFFRLYTRVQDLEARSMDTRLKQLASIIRRKAEESNARVVLVEDFSTPWTPTGPDTAFVRILKRMPWAAAEGILKTELEEHGIQFKKIAQAHNWHVCPACGAETKLVDDFYVDCPECGIFCSKHIIATWNMFKIAGLDVTALAETKRKASFATRASREKKLCKAKEALEAAQQAAE